MRIIQSLIILLGCFIAGYIFLSSSFRLMEKRNYEAASIGIMLTAIVCAFIFRVVMFL